MYIQLIGGDGWLMTQWVVTTILLISNIKFTDDIIAKSISGYT